MTIDVTALVEEISQLMVPHKYLWDEMSKSDKECRKEEWEKIKKSLKVLARIEFRGSYMKYHKSLFMSGDVKPFIKSIIESKNIQPESIQDMIKKARRGFLSGGDSFAYAFPLFYMWYLPNMTDNLADEIVDHFTKEIFSSGNGFTGLSRSRELLWNRFPQGNYSDNGSYGKIGPRVSYIAPRLIGEKGQKALFDQRGSNSESDFYLSAEVIFPKLSVQGLLAGKSIPDYTMGRYIWKQGSWYLKPFVEYVKECKSDSDDNNLEIRLMQFENIIQSIEMLFFFETHPNSAKDSVPAIECCGEILQQYHNNQFSPEMNALFELIESNGIGNTSVDDVLELI